MGGHSSLFTLIYTLQSVFGTDVGGLEHLGYFGVDLRGEVFFLHLTLVAAALLADADQTFRLLLLAYNKHVGDTAQLVVADLAANLLIAAVNTGTDALLSEVVLDVLGVVVELL